jgi:hypothetical protein
VEPVVMGIEDDNAVEPVLVPTEAKHWTYDLCNAPLLRKLNPPPPNATSVTDTAKALLEKEEEEDKLIVENIIRNAADTATAFTKLNPLSLEIRASDTISKIWFYDKIFEEDKAG